MPAAKQYLAIDLGAESGRGVLGTLRRGKLTLEETHRFPNGPTRVLDSLHWNALGLFAEIKNAIRASHARAGGALRSIGVDTWGVDFGLIDKKGGLVGHPYHYRDSRTDGMMERAFLKLSRERFYELTGIQFMQFNTVYQLYAMVLGKSPLLQIADTLLMMPDLIDYLLTGVKCTEFSNATTTQLYDVRKRRWAKPIFDALGLPRGLMPEVLPPGAKVGALLKAVAEETGAGRVGVVAPATHDTGSAVAAVPARGGDWAYLSSGTWSLMGVELPKPLINAGALKHEYTNEGGVGYTTRFLKNIMGLWLVQECRRDWAAAGKDYNYDQITAMAAKARPFASLVDPNHAPFAKIGGMAGKIQQFCRKTRQRVPETHGEIVRCALESLALRYRMSLETIEELTGRKIQVLHIVGGGSKNRLLNQFAANATGVPVVTGPVEATAAGNIMVQAIADGELASLEEGRELIRRSFECETFEPRDREAWDEAYGRFMKLV